MPVMSSQGDLLHVVTTDNLSPSRVALGRGIMWVSGLALVLLFALQTAQANGWIDLGFETWRPTLYAFLTWAVALCWGQVLARGAVPLVVTADRGLRARLPAGAQVVGPGWLRALLDR